MKTSSILMMLPIVLILSCSDGKMVWDLESPPATEAPTPDQRVASEFQVAYQENSVGDIAVKELFDAYISCVFDDNDSAYSRELRLALRVPRETLDLAIGFNRMNPVRSESLYLVNAKLEPKDSTRDRPRLSFKTTNIEKELMGRLELRFFQGENEVLLRSKEVFPALGFESSVQNPAEDAFGAPIEETRLVRNPRILVGKGTAATQITFEMIKDDGQKRPVSFSVSSEKLIACFAKKLTAF